jgi:hypothetical protein
MLIGIAFRYLLVTISVDSELLIRCFALGDRKLITSVNVKYARQMLSGDRIMVALLDWFCTVLLPWTEEDCPRRHRASLVKGKVPISPQ